MAEQQGRGKLYSYPEDVFGELETSLSSARMSIYLEAIDGNWEKAARLYAWNTAVSAAFYASLQALEVALRNAMHAQLACRYGVPWYDNRNAGLDPPARPWSAGPGQNTSRTGCHWLAMLTKALRRLRPSSLSMNTQDPLGSSVALDRSRSDGASSLETSPGGMAAITNISWPAPLASVPVSLRSMPRSLSVHAPGRLPQEGVSYGIPLCQHLEHSFVPPPDTVEIGNEEALVSCRTFEAPSLAGRRQGAVRTSRTAPSRTAGIALVLS